MADTTTSPFRFDSFSIYTSDEVDELVMKATPCDSASESAAINISQKPSSPSSKGVLVCMSWSIEIPKNGSATDSRSSLVVALEEALPPFFSSLSEEYNNLEILATRGLVDSDWPTWLPELMNSPRLDEVIKRLHSLKFNFITLDDGGRGGSNEIYTINHPKGPNGTATTVIAECTLLAEHLDKLAYIDGLNIPGWTMVTNKLHILDPFPDSLSLINVTDDDVTPWNSLINFLVSHPEITSLKLPGTLSKHMNPAMFFFTVVMKHKLDFLDLGGQHEKLKLALQMPNGHWYNGPPL